MDTLSTIFCYFLFLFFSFVIFVSRLKPWCNCHICRTYLHSTWSNHFPNLSDWYTHLLTKSQTGTIHIHVLNNVITSNPQNVQHILKTKFHNYPKGKSFNLYLSDLLGRGIFNVDGDSWKFQRKLASLELGSVNVRSFAFNTTATQIRNRLIPLLSSFANENKRFDLQDVFRRFSFDVICKFSFGVDLGCLEMNLPMSDFANAFDLASKLSAERSLSTFHTWKIKRFFNIGSERKLKEAIKIVNKLAERIMENRRQIGFLNKNDLLSRFMGTISDEKYLKDIVINFLLAGRDTIGSGLTTFFWLISQRPEIETKIREESNRVMSRENELATYEETRDMHYLNAAIHESLRLYPPVQFDSKFAREDDELPDGTRVNRGTRVTYHPYAMGRMERVWGEDCTEFKPERWLRDGRFVEESLFKYPVFQGGARVCLGKEMALVEMKLVAVALIRRFDVRVVMKESGGVIRFVSGLTATVDGGLQVVVKDRNGGC